MTNLEILLIGVLWAVYGAFIAHRWNQKNPFMDSGGFYLSCIVFAPIVLLVKVIGAIFWIEE